MSWLRIDDNLLDTPQWGLAVLDGGSAAVHLWLALSLWACKHLSDGEVPAHMLKVIAGPRGARVTGKAYRALIAAGLLERRADGSVRLVDHLERHPSRDDVMERRRRWKDAQQKHRKGHKVMAGVSDDDGATEEDDADESQSTPSRPVPIPTRRQREDRHTEGAPPVAQEGCPVVWHTLDGWVEPIGLEDEAVAAGVPRDFYRARVEQLRNTTIGGQGGVRDRTTYIRQQLGRWRTWAESERAKGRPSRDRPNQPNCGLTGLEGAEEVRCDTDAN
jgi:hypothetical protein